MSVKINVFLSGSTLFGLIFESKISSPGYPGEETSGDLLHYFGFSTPTIDREPSFIPIQL